MGLAIRIGYGNSIAFTNHSLDRSLFSRLRDLYGSSIALAIRSFDPSLSTQLIPHYPFS